MNSKKPEDVRKRRAKPETSSSNVYQKMILVAGVLTLFLAIGLSPMMAPILAAGIVGGTLLLFFLVRRIRPKGKESKGIEPVEPPRPVEEISPGHRDILLTEEEEGSFDSPEIPPEEKEPAELRAISLEEREEGTPKEAVKDQESVPGEKAPRKDRQEFPANGTLADMQQRLILLEERANTLEDLLVQLEGKFAHIQETQAKSEPQIDLQTILSNLDEKHGRIVP